MMDELMLSSRVPKFEQIREISWTKLGESEEVTLGKDRVIKSTDKVFRSGRFRRRI